MPYFFRRFRAAFGVLCFLFLFAALPDGNAQTDEWRAWWVDAWGAGLHNQSQVETLLGKPGDPNSLGRIREANCNAVFVQVRRRFDVAYPSGVGEPYMSGLSPSNFNALEAIIKAAHDTTGGKKRIEVHCWSVVFKTSKGQVYNQHSDTPPTGSLTEFDNYWPTRKGWVGGAENGDGAFDPGHPKALEYLVDAHMDLVNFQTTAGPDGTDGRIDGIHYDYIRFEANDEGFNPTSVARYKARYGLSEDPQSSDEQFKQWRRDQVTAFVRQMYARIQKVNPAVQQSASFVTWNPSPVASTRAAFRNTRPYYDVYSDWDSWTEEGIIDMSVPMTYYNQNSLPNDYVRWMNFEKDRAFDRHMIIGPGVYLNSLQNALLQLNLTRDPSPAGNHAHGFSGYSYRVPYAGGNWPAFSPSLVSQVTPTWADIPEMPWKVAPTKAHIMGEVTIAETGRWADHAIVNISGPVNRTMHVDGTGFYAFIDLPPGSYTVSASLDGYPNAQATADVAIGEVTGNMYERDLVLSDSPVPPQIVTQPVDQMRFAGEIAAFSVVADGTPPFDYQWKFNGTEIEGATKASLILPSVGTDKAGDYSVTVSNFLGDDTSGEATLSVRTPFTPLDIEELWSLAPGDHPQLSASAHLERGLAYNPVTGNVLFISRAGERNIYVIDGDTGDSLRTLNVDPAIVNGGHFDLLLLGVADDGVVYAGNLSINTGAPNFKLYRWENDSAAAVPAVAFAGNPSPGNGQRWGDTMSVRGAGANTQILIASRLGSIVSILTTTNGVDFTSTPISVSGVPGGGFGLGIAFGAGDTFWGKSTDEPLRRVAFDLGEGTGTVLDSFNAEQFPNGIRPIGANSVLNLLGGINVTGQNTLELFAIGQAGEPPAPIATAPFATQNENSFYVGSVAFGSDRVYALDSNNGILALQFVGPPGFVRVESIDPLEDGRIKLIFSGEPGSYILETSEDLNAWSELTEIELNGGSYEFIDSESDDPRRFYRLKSGQ